MEENEKLDNIAVKELMPKIYDDVVHPSAKETGKLLNLIPRVINAALEPVWVWVNHRENSIKEVEKILEDKLKNVDTNKIVQPEPYVAVPILQAISYCIDCSELRELYANLLANAMNTDKKDYVHPIFVDIIKSLSPLDAYVLKHINDDCVPLADFVLESNLTPGIYSIINTNIACIDNLDPLRVACSIDILSNKGLVEVRNEQYEDISLYKPIFDSEYYKQCKVESSGFAKQKLALHKKSIQITNLGKQFNNICLNEF